MESGTSPFIPFFLGLAITSGLLVPILLRLRSAVGDARIEKSSADQQFAQLKLIHAALQEDLRFLTQFLKDYPRLARQLYGGLGERQIPGELLAIVQRSLDPQQVAVLVKRSEAKGEGSSDATPGRGGSLPGRLGGQGGHRGASRQGEIGFAAESQIDVNRQDLQAETAQSRIKPGPGLPGMPQPDLIAPLVFDQDTLGVIVVAKPRKTGDPKAALRLVAQTGAQVLHTAIQVSRMKTTAERDGLTRIYNKKHMDQTLNELVYRAAFATYDQRSARRGAAGAVSLRLRVRHRQLQDYNDTNRHLAGDKLLQELAGLVHDARCARTTVRPLRRRGVPARPAPHGRDAGHRGGAEDPQPARRPRLPLRGGAAARVHQHQRRGGRVPVPRARRRRAAPRVGRGAVRGQAQREKPCVPGEDGRTGAGRGPRRGPGEPPQP